jgi:hypothetical protein
MTMPSAERVLEELSALGDVVPDVPDHAAEMDQTGMAGQRGGAGEIPGRAGQPGDAG